MIIRDVVKLENSTSDQWDGTDIEPGHPRNVSRHTGSNGRQFKVSADHTEDNRVA